MPLDFYSAHPANVHKGYRGLALPIDARKSQADSAIQDPGLRPLHEAHAGATKEIDHGTAHLSQESHGKRIRQTYHYR